MTPYIDDKVPDEIKEAFGQIRNIVKKMPDVDLGKTDRNYPIYISCHMVARAIRNLYPFMKLHDGYFGGIYEHSWLTVTPLIAIDPYPWAALGGPVLVSLELSSPWNKIYREAAGPRKNYFQKMFSSSKFREHAEIVSSAAWSTARQLGYVSDNRQHYVRRTLCEEKRS